MLTRFRNIAYMMAYAVATIPLWHYIRDGRILALMVAVVTFAYLNVVLSTVQAAQPIFSSEKAKTPLPRWLPDKPKYQKSWLLVRHTLKWHLLLIPPKMGLALGFVEFFNGQIIAFVPWGDTWGYWGSTGRIIKMIFLQPYIYFANSIRWLDLYPRWDTVALGVFLSTALAIVGSFLLSAIIIKLLSGKDLSKYKTLSWAGLQYCFAIFGICGFIFIITGLYDKHLSYPCELSNLQCTFEEHQEQESMSRAQYRRNVRIGETLNIAIFTLVDNGVLLSANIMRPTSSPAVEYDNRPFVARQIVAGLLGLLLYAGATWVVLWFVEDETEIVKLHST